MTARILLPFALVLLLSACEAAGDRTTHTDSTGPGPAPATRALVDPSSPWSDAAARGVAFRAVGNEPGWYVEVDHGEAPQLRATLDYGEREIAVAHAKPLDGDAFGFHGKLDDGTEIVLMIRREPCRDVMSGAPFEASAQLRVGDSNYDGCGTFLSR